MEKDKSDSTDLGEVQYEKQDMELFFMQNQGDYLTPSDVFCSVCKDEMDRESPFLVFRYQRTHVIEDDEGDQQKRREVFYHPLCLECNAKNDYEMMGLDEMESSFLVHKVPRDHIPGRAIAIVDMPVALEPSKTRGGFIKTVFDIKDFNFTNTIDKTKFANKPGHNLLDDENVQIGDPDIGKVEKEKKFRELDEEKVDKILEGVKKESEDAVETKSHEERFEQNKKKRMERKKKRNAHQSRLEERRKQREKEQEMQEQQEADETVDKEPSIDAHLDLKDKGADEGSEGVEEEDVDVDVITLDTDEPVDEDEGGEDDADEKKEVEESDDVNVEYDDWDFNVD